MAYIKLVIKGQYVRIILKKNVVAFSCILIFYGGLAARHMNNEFLE
jgi:hypothetical protein